MYRLAFVFCFVLSVVTLEAQTEAKDFSQYGKEGWHVLMEEAMAESAETGKPILANFTGSDWCGWCKRLSAAVFNKPEFKKWAEDNVVLLELDFPRRTQLPEELRKQNAGLQQVFKVSGYPTVWIFDIEKNEESGKLGIKPYGKTGYRPNVETFTSEIDAMIAKASAMN